MADIAAYGVKVCQWEAGSNALPNIQTGYQTLANNGIIERYVEKSWTKTEKVVYRTKQTTLEFTQQHCDYPAGSVKRCHHSVHNDLQEPDQ